MMVGALSGTRNSANYHSQPVERASGGAGIPVVRRCLGGTSSADAFSTPADIRRRSGVFEVHGNAISQ